MRQNPGTANALATKMYEERLKLPLRDSLDDAAIKVIGLFSFLDSVIVIISKFLTILGNLCSKDLATVLVSFWIQIMPQY